jgi:hypothetical protein
MARSDEGNEFWVDPAEAAEVKPRVQVRYLNHPGMPLWMGAGYDGTLRTLSVSQARGSTIFRIPDDDWIAVVRAAKANGGLG